MTKVLYLPLNTPEFYQTGVYDAFKDCGVELEIFDFHIYKKAHHDIRKDFLKVATDFSPDLIHTQLQFTNIIDVKTLLEVKQLLPNVITSNWSGDIRSHVPNEYISNAKAIDYNLISSSGQLDLYSQAIGKKTHYLQIGYNPKLYYPIPKTTFSWDAAFIANNWTASNFPGQGERITVIKELRSLLGTRFGLFGNNWRTIDKNSLGSVPLSDLNDYYTNSFCCISVSNFNNVKHYFSDRLLMCLASGRPTISLAFPGWEDYFIDNVDIVIADTPAQISLKVAELLKNPQKANEIGIAGQKKVFSEHSYYCRILELLRLVGLK